MQVIDALIEQVNDEKLKERLKQEVRKLQDNKKFGLVFENHIPEATPLYGAKITKGLKVTEKNGKFDRFYIVREINDDEAICEQTRTGIMSVKPLDGLLPVAELGDPIYPSLKKIDQVMNAPGSDLWHTLIEADNYHALQLLEYLYAGKVDCIYIDPPYNTGAKDWKYNNDYVDSTDAYRHSKWLSFMEKRLKLAKKLLNPKDSVLIVTIDEKEYLHLGMLLEQMFPEAKMQMISSCINVGGVARDKQFYRSDEYIFIVAFGKSGPQKLELTDEWYGVVKKTTRNSIRWRELRRTGTHDLREEARNQFYPIFVSSDGKRIISVGESYYGNNRAEIVAPADSVAIWPLFPDGREGCWRVSQDTVRELYKDGYIRFGKFTDVGMAISYIARGEQEKVKQGIYNVIGHRDDGSIIVDTDNYVAKFLPTTQWRITSHDATQYGTRLNHKLIPDRKFPYPKSLYAIEDVLRFFVADKPDALIVDFFAGSGTTLHATMLLNHIDGGHRRCILVTNNEVSNDEAKMLTKQGLTPDNPEWEKYGIARYVTWPRTRAAITGINTLGEPIKGNYKFTEEFPMSDGFKANVIYFKLEFLNKTAVRIGRQFRELLSILWMKAGAHGECPEIPGVNVPPMLILPENQMAILKKESLYSEFLEKVKAEPSIKTLYFITDSVDNYRNMISNFRDYDTYQLYSDYLDNFRINGEEVRQ